MMISGVSHHTIIAGTGRAGTSLLVRLLESCGLQTQTKDSGNGLSWHETASAGLEELMIGEGPHPYIVKSPWTYELTSEIFSRKDIKVDHVLIPVRGLREATVSRLVVERQSALQNGDHLALHGTVPLHSGSAAGGAVFSLHPLDQARCLALSLHLLLEDLLRFDVPFSFLVFPRFAQDVNYCFKLLSTALPLQLSFSDFEAIHKDVVNQQDVKIEGEFREVTEDSAVEGNRNFPDQLSIALKATTREVQRVTRKLKVAIALNGDLMREITRLQEFASDLSEKNHRNYAARCEIEKSFNTDEEHDTEQQNNFL